PRHLHSFPTRRSSDLHGFVINDWGRKMWIEEGRAFTQAPALQGQSGTREIACDFLLSLPYKAMRTVKAFVHDAFVFSVPKDRFEECRDYLVKKMTTSFKPKKGVNVSSSRCPLALRRTTGWTLDTKGGNT